MCRFTRFLLFFACLLLLVTAIVPPRPAYSGGGNPPLPSNGDPDEIIEQTEIPPRTPPWNPNNPPPGGVGGRVESEEGYGMASSSDSCDSEWWSVLAELHAFWLSLVE
jgi:hypothetical protein